MTKNIFYLFSLLIFIICIVPSRSASQKEAKETFIAPVDPEFNPEYVETNDDARHFACSADNGTCVLVDDKKGVHYDSVSFIQFIPHSGSVVYKAKRQGKWFIVNDGKEENGKYDRIGWIVPEPLTFAAKLGEKWIVISNGKESKAYSEIWRPSVSSDGKRVGFGAKADAKWVAVIDGVEGKLYDNVGDIIFSPDGMHTMWDVKINNKYCIVYDNKEQKLYDDIRAGIFSPDGKRYVYGGTLKADDSEFIVENGKEGKHYERVNFYIFSPDSKHLVYVAHDWSGDMIIKDGKVLKKLKDIVDSPMFSPDSKHLVYIVEKDEGKIIVIDGKEYSPSGKLVGEKIGFDSPTSFHYLTLRDDMVYLVEQELK